MKKMKKLLSMLLTVIMVLAMAAPSFADTSTSGSITIKNPIDGQTYKAYKIFDLIKASDADNDGGYAYTVESGWVTFFTTGAGKNFVNLQQNNDGKYNVVPFEGEVDAGGKPVVIKDVEGLAKAIRAAINDATLVAGSVTYNKTTDGAMTEVTISNLSLGYYLVDSTVGTLCGLNTTNPNMAFIEKNQAPTIDKQLTNSDDANVAVNDKIEYKVTVTAQPGAQNYVVNDTMTKGLTFNNDVTVKVGNDALTVDTDYTVSAVTTAGNGDSSFSITFKEDYCKTIAKETIIVIEYTATVNKDAVTVNKVTNKASLTYGEENNITTTPTTPDVDSLTYQFDLQKVDTNKAQLSGAEFELYESESSTEPVKFIDLGEKGEEGAKKHYYRIAEKTVNQDGTTTYEANATTTIVAGYAVIQGLDKDITSYYLKETKAPAGYNLLNGRKLVSNITRDMGNSTVDQAEQIIENSTGTILPSTGGIGTTIFYAAGIILMAGAVFFVVRRKRA